MASLNRVSLIGNLGADPEIRSAGSGNRCANLRVATSETWRDKSSGEKKEKTEWHRVVVWGPLVEIVEKYLRKGSKVMLEGKLQNRKWTDTEGVERYSTEVVMQGFDAKMIMLDGKGDRDDGDADDGRSGGGYQRDGSGGGNQSRHSRPSEREEFSHDLDDEIPF